MVVVVLLLLLLLLVAVVVVVGGRHSPCACESQPKPQRRRLPSSRAASRLDRHRHGQRPLLPHRCDSVFDRGDGLRLGDGGGLLGLL